MRYFFVVGEASADLHASRLIEAIKELDEESAFSFMGGDLMARAAGCAPVIHYREVAFMGIVPVLKNLGKIRRAARAIQQALLEFRPDVVIPVDYAGFNLRYILPFAKRHMPTPIVYYIAPKLWAWKSWRINKLRKYVDHLLVILPFEQEYFAQRGVPTTYVGNPCVDATREVRASLPEAAETARQIALLAGSRKQELASNLPVMLQAAYPWRSTHRIVLAGAPGLSPADYSAYLSAYPEVELRFGDTYRIASESSVALVTSGTATLEVGLIGTPQIVLYRMGGQRMLRWIFDRFFAAPYISLVNLILGRGAVPELIGSEASAEAIAPLLSELLPDSLSRAAQIASVQELRQRLGDTSASQRAATTLFSLLKP